MSLLYFIRHADHDLLGRELVGRREVPLSRRGLEQAERLGDTLAGTAFAAVLSSPRERARQTAAAIAERQECTIELVPALDEIDFGTWTGCSFAALEGDARWQLFNRERSRAAIPGGELMRDVQSRIAALIAALARRDPEDRVVLVSHGDVIRTALLHSLGLSLDSIHLLEVAPASISVLSARGEERRLLALNIGFEGLGPEPQAVAGRCVDCPGGDGGGRSTS